MIRQLGFYPSMRQTSADYTYKRGFSNHVVVIFQTGHGRDKMSVAGGPPKKSMATPSLCVPRAAPRRSKLAVLHMRLATREAMDERSAEEETEGPEGRFRTEEAQI